MTGALADRPGLARLLRVRLCRWRLDRALAEALAVSRSADHLTNGTGPLYNPASEHSMSERVSWIVDGLQPCPPHVWGCPRVMKLDPDHVACTCERCATIATGDHPGGEARIVR